MIVGIRNEYAIAEHDETDDAEADLLLVLQWSFEGLLEADTREIEEGEVGTVLDDERLAILCEGEIDRATREDSLNAGGFEDLIGWDDDPAIGLFADRE